MVQDAIIHIVDDDPSIRSALARLLEAGGFAVQSYDSAERFVDAAPREARGCILLDLNMPGIDGLELQARLAHAGNLLPIVFLTGSGDFESSVRAIKAGAEDFLAKPVRGEALFDAIGRALQRHDAARRERQDLQTLTARMHSLTPREREVFHLVVLGLLNKQIAYQLGNTERTVKEQRRSVMEKMGVASLAELVLCAARLKVIDAR